MQAKALNGIVPAKKEGRKALARDIWLLRRIHLDKRTRHGGEKPEEFGPKRKLKWNVLHPRCFLRCTLLLIWFQRALELRREREEKGRKCKNEKRVKKGKKKEIGQVDKKIFCERRFSFHKVLFYGAFPFLSLQRQLCSTFMAAL